MDVGIADVIPYALRNEIHSEGVRCFFVMSEGVCPVIPAAAYASADQTYPEVHF